KVGRVRFALEAGATLDPIAVATVGALAIKLEGAFDYFLLDPENQAEHQMKGTGKISIPILPLLFFTAGLDVFATKVSGSPWGTSYDTTLGLRVHLDAAHQSF